MPRPTRKPIEPAPPAPVCIVLSVKITDGSFQSDVQVRVDAPKEERDRAIRRWLDIMAFAIKLPGDVEIRQST